MGIELLLLSALIFIFIVSFCGLLQKIKQSYERERIIADISTKPPPTYRTNSSLLWFSLTPVLMILLAISLACKIRKCNDRVARRHQQQSASVSDGFVNITYIENENSSSIFPEAPPPYTHAEPPPKYDDVIKDRDVSITVNVPSNTLTNPTPNGRRPIAVLSTPPPYTIPV